MQRFSDVPLPLTTPLRNPATGIRPVVMASFHVAGLCISPAYWKHKLMKKWGNTVAPFFFFFSDSYSYLYFLFFSYIYFFFFLFFFSLSFFLSFFVFFIFSFFLLFSPFFPFFLFSFFLPFSLFFFLSFFFSFFLLVLFTFLFFFSGYSYTARRKLKVVPLEVRF
jgi:hypothetical protein